MSYNKLNLQSPNIESTIKEKWITIKNEKIPIEEKIIKWKDYVYELEKIKTINKKESDYLISEYSF